jgi:hypothetical protein
MKKIFVILLIATSSYCSYAQNTFPATGNVGIGTTSPAAKLNVTGAQEAIRVTGIGTTGVASVGFLTFYDSDNTTRRGYIGDASSGNSDLYFSADVGNGINFGSGGLNSRMFINPSGYVGVGTSTPVTLFNVAVANAKSTVAGSVASLLSTNDAANPFGLRTMVYGAAAITDRYVTLQTTDYSLADGGSLILQPSTGNVGIGTTNPQGYKLAVNGSAIATSMTVKLYANWPDFVFKPTYQLPALSDIKTYIDKNHHLPDVPTAAEVEKNGINLGEMNKVLLQKVEELTLYLLEKDKQIKALEQQTIRFQSQQKQINKLKKSLDNLNHLKTK